MTDQEHKDSVASVVDCLSALTANQAILIELLHDNLPHLSPVERSVVAKCANNNYTIAENLQGILKQLRNS